MKRYALLIILILTLIQPHALAQLTLDGCQQKARANYPLLKRAALIDQAAVFTIDNAAKAFLPQIVFSAKATYQSDVTEIPIKLPNVNIEGMSKDQYQAVAEVNQVVWDGGLVKAQQEVAKANADAEKQKLEADLYALRERVNQVFFGILLIEEQLKQNNLLQKELQVNLDKVKAYRDNGIANQPDVDAVQVELLNVAQRRTELEATSLAFRQMLSGLIGETVAGNAHLETPALLIAPSTDLANRPEIAMFDSQSRLLGNQSLLINARNMPKVGAFVQGGYGKPGLNMLKNEFQPFAIGGVRFNWNFGGLYTKKNDLQLIAVNQSGVQLQKEAFIYNTHLQAIQQNGEVEKCKRLVAADDEIISLRNSIKLSAESRVANGTLPAADLIREINAENMARQNKALHEIQYLISVYNLKNTTNH